jgi:hypothetical protein
MKNFIITITLVVPPEADEQLQTPHSIEDEVRSWLTGLHAVVHAVTVKERLVRQRELEATHGAPAHPRYSEKLRFPEGASLLKTAHCWGILSNTVGITPEKT